MQNETDSSPILHSAFSILHSDEPRFVMLETIREYAMDHLRESVEAHATRQRHAQFYLTLAESMNKEARGLLQATMLNRLEIEHDNIRAALQWCLSDEADSELSLRLAAELGWFWFVRGHWEEGRRWLRSALTAGRQILSGPAPQNTQVMHSLARALSAAGRLALKQGDHGEAGSLLEECLVWRRKLDEEQGIAGILIQLGELAHKRGDLSRARSYFEKSLVILRKLGDKTGIADTLNNIAFTVQDQGDSEQARSLFNESILMHRELGDAGAVANGLQNLAHLALDQGEDRYATAFTEESMKLAQELDLRPLVADAQFLLALLALRHDEYQQCREQLNKCLVYYHATHNRESTIACLMLSAQLTLAVAGTEDTARNAVEQVMLTASARLFGASHNLQTSTGTVLNQADRKNFESALGMVREQLTEEDFRLAWEEGHALVLSERGMEQVIAFALDPTILPATGEPGEHAQAPAPSPASGTRGGKSTHYPEGLTRREVEVLRVVTQGLTNAQIAERLFLSPNTVNGHLYSIYSKLGVSSRSAATRFAFEHDLN